MGMTVERGDRRARRMATRWSLLVSALAVACARSETQATLGHADDTGSSGASTAIATGDGTAIAPTDDDATDPTPSDESSTVATAPGTSGTDGGESSTGEPTPPPIQFCGLEDLKHGAPNPIVSGTEPMQIPPDIATILVDSCGCHYADMLDVGPPVADYSSTLPLHIETWEQWQGSYGFPMNLKPTLPAVLDRVQDSPLQFTMPHRSCNVGDGEQMVPAQREVLIDWILAGAPDGATWVP
jgi:hypothetical protein